MPAAQRREVILAAAEETFAESGYHGASLDDVAHAAGVSKALIYEHFESKRDLHASLLDADAAEIFRRLEAAADSGGTGEERLRDRHRRVPAGSSRRAARRGGRCSATPPTPRSAALVAGVQAQATGVIARLIAADPDAPARLAADTPTAPSASRSTRSCSPARSQSLATWWHDHREIPRATLVDRAMELSGTARRRGRPPRRCRRCAVRVGAPAPAAAPPPSPGPAPLALRALTAPREGIRAARAECRAGWSSSASIPALANTGYGVVARRCGRLAALDGGVIETPRAASRPSGAWPAIHARVARPARRARARRRRRSRPSTSARTSRTRVRRRPGARRRARSRPAQRGIPCADYTPQQVKGAVCGSGPRRQGRRSSAWSRRCCALPEPPRPDHAADALAVAICHANHGAAARAVDLRAAAR